MIQRKPKFKSDGPSKEGLKFDLSTLHAREKFKGLCTVADAGNVKVLVAGDSHGCGVDLGFDRAEQFQIGIVDGYATPREDKQITILVGLDGSGIAGKLGPRFHDRLE